MCPFESVAKEHEKDFVCWAYIGKGMTPEQAIAKLRGFATVIFKHVTLLRTINKMAAEVLTETKMYAAKNKKERK